MLLYYPFRKRAGQGKKRGNYILSKKTVTADLAVPTFTKRRKGGPATPVKKIIYLTQGSLSVRVRHVSYLPDFLGTCGLFSLSMCLRACAKTFGWNTCSANSWFAMSLGCFSDFFFAIG
jgi:hypothetical protein